MTEDTLIDFSPELRAEAKEILARFTHGPLYTPPSLEGTINMPGWGGGANWWGAAFDPETSMYYIPSSTSPIRVGLTQPDPSRSDFRYTRGGDLAVPGPQGLPLSKPPYGRITAIDLDTGDHAWWVPHGDGPRQRVIALGLPDPGPLGGASATGPVLTKTLLFVGLGARARGAQEGGEKSQLRVFDKATGSIVREIPLELAPAGTPMTYMADGRQFIVVAAGGGPRAVLYGLALPKSALEGAAPSGGGAAAP
jgi:quinoprotein glucose dehydrogenase